MIWSPMLKSLLWFCSIFSRADLLYFCTVSNLAQHSPQINWRHMAPTTRLFPCTQSGRVSRNRTAKVNLVLPLLRGCLTVGEVISAGTTQALVSCRVMTPHHQPQHRCREPAQTVTLRIYVSQTFSQCWVVLAAGRWLAAPDSLVVVWQILRWPCGCVRWPCGRGRVGVGARGEFQEKKEFRSFLVGRLWIIFGRLWERKEV